MVGKVALSRFKRFCPKHKDLDELSLQASFFNVSFPLYMRQTHVLHAPRFQSIKLSFCKLWSSQGVQHGVQHVEAVPHTRGEGWGRLPLRQLGNTQVGECATGWLQYESRFLCNYHKNCVEIVPTQGMKQFDRSCKFLQTRFLFKGLHISQWRRSNGHHICNTRNNKVFCKKFISSMKSSTQAFTAGIMCLSTFSLLMWEETKMHHSW